MNEPLEANSQGPSTDMEDIWEVPVLLPGCYFRELEEAACRRGLTTAELLRGLIMSFLDSHNPQH